MRTRAVLFAVVAVLLASCGDDDAADDTTTTSAGAETTTTSEAETTTTSESAGGTGDACPDAAPLPDGAEGLSEAPVAFDGDGDGMADTLSAYLDDGQWWLHVEWAAGGTSVVEVDDASEMLGIRPLGGHPLGDATADVAWVAIGGPASGSIIGLYRAEGCELVPVLDADTGTVFSFSVTGSIGTFSGATCDGIGDLDLFLGELVDDEAGEYTVAQSPYSYADGALTAEFGDAGSVTFEESSQYATLDCGDLASAL
ncbi:MAG: hypothetical protein ACXIVQ_07625 [Acidimicrobiales bacterium]